MIIRTTSFENDNGMTPLVETLPIVVFSPTSPFRSEGEIIEPSVSVPSDIAAMFAAIDTADPVLEPDGSLPNTYGQIVCPPRPLHPLGISSSLKL